MRKLGSERRRDAAVTRAAILASAREAFARAGYQGAGVREIARGAGVTAMLVNRYFGSKERLFAQVLEQTMATPTILTREQLRSRSADQALAAAVVALTRPGAAPLDGFLILIRSASSKRAAAIGRRQIERHHQRLLAGTLKGNDRRERAAIVLALVLGAQVMRQLVELPALSRARPRTLVKILAPLFRRLLRGS